MTYLFPCESPYLIRSKPYLKPIIHFSLVCEINASFILFYQKTLLSFDESDVGFISLIFDEANAYKLSEYLSASIIIYHPVLFESLQNSSIV